MGFPFSQFFFVTYIRDDLEMISGSIGLKAGAKCYSVGTPPHGQTRGSLQMAFHHDFDQ